MFEFGAGKTFREQAVQCFFAHEVPIFQAHNLHAGDAVAPQFSQRKIKPFNGRPGVFKMAVDQYKATHAIMAKAPDHIAYHKSKRIGVEADRTRKSFTAAGARLRLITVGEGRRDKPADLAGNALTYPGGEHNV